MAHNYSASASLPTLVPGLLSAGFAAASVYQGERMIPDEKIAEMRDRAPIAEIVGAHVTLKRSGNSLRGLCPFHNEKTPSFYVHPSRGFYHCFGCAASGDVFSFLMHVEGKSFPEIARLLSERTGVELPANDPKAEAAYQRQKTLQERLAAVMESAAVYYEGQLKSHAHSAIARDEVASRNIGEEASTDFRLGYAPEGWDGLVKHLSSVGSSPADAESLGLIVRKKSGNGHYDRFRHRLLFPIRDLHGRVVAFSGRALKSIPPDPHQGQAGNDDAQRDPPAKYVNSPEGPLYTKGQILFGLHEARVAIRREGYAVVCEGNFDLLAMHQAGFVNTVAPMGTAFTEAHVKLLKRFTQRVVLMFDGDAAGKKAVREAQPLLSKLGLAAAVVTLPEGSDPDMFLREHDADTLRKRLDDAQGIIEFLIDEAATNAVGDPQKKANAIASLGPVLAGVESPVEAGLYVERVARKFGVHDLNAVRRELRRAVRAVKAPRASTTPASPRKAAPPVDGLQSKLISVLIDQPSLITNDATRNLPELLTSPDLQVIFQTILQMMQTRGELDATTLMAELQGNAMQSWVEERLALQEHDLEGATLILCDGVPRLAQKNIESELPRLQQRIVEARRLGDDASAAELTEKFVAMSRSAHKLKQHGSFKR